MRHLRSFIAVTMKHGHVTICGNMMIPVLTGFSYVAMPQGPSGSTPTIDWSLRYLLNAMDPVTCTNISADPPMGIGTRVVRAWDTLGGCMEKDDSRSESSVPAIGGTGGGIYAILDTAPSLPYGGRWADRLPACRLLRDRCQAANSDVYERPRDARPSGVPGEAASSAAAGAIASGDELSTVPPHYMADNTGAHNKLQDMFVAEREEELRPGDAEIRGRGASPGEDVLTTPQGGRWHGGGIALVIRGPVDGPGAREDCTIDGETRGPAKRQALNQPLDQKEDSQLTEVHEHIGSKRIRLAAPRKVGTDGDVELGTSPSPQKSKEDSKIHFAAMEMHDSTCTGDLNFHDSSGRTTGNNMRLGEERAGGSDEVREIDDARSHAAAAWAWHGSNSRCTTGTTPRLNESAR